MIDFNSSLFTPSVCNDQYVVFTTTVRGEIDVAIVPTGELVKHSS